MLRTVMLVFLLVWTSFNIAAQSERGVPQLQRTDRPVIVDERARAGGETIIWRSGTFPVPLTPRALLHVGVPASMTTKKLDEYQLVPLSLPLRSPIENPNQGKYADINFLVESVISGHSSGVKDRSLLKVEPKQILVEVRATDYIVIARENGQYVVLKPGRWRFDLKCSLMQAVTPEGQSWSLAHDPEAVGIKGDKWGPEPNPQAAPDPLGSVFPFVPGVPAVVSGAASAVGQIIDEAKKLFHRPNIVVTPGSDMYFRIDRMTATYIGPPTPKGPMELDTSRP